MKRFKNKYTVFGIILLSFMVFVYWVGTWNIHIFNTIGLFNTAFEYTNSTWVCKSYNLKAEVIEKSDGFYMTITDMNTTEKYTLQSLDFQTVDLYNHNPSRFDVPLYTRKVEYKKHWGKVYKFIICGVNKDCWYEKGNDSISFELIE